ncbi:MAG TPA: peptide-methionine (R)-S-oxide reductase MsrB [Tepidisphaeraceae bacterium]|nr:peptide-methionine (R)-S-oxide reductase MsrB [Tepidisphaeraceae bacterium]
MRILACAAGLFAASAVYVGTAAFSENRSSNERLVMDQNAPSTRPAASCGVDENSACGTAHWKAKTDTEWRQLLTPEQYRIAREAGTERPFTGKYWNTHTPGVYHCAVCNQPLFSSDTKFESGTGWPSFYKPISTEAITTEEDHAYGMVRTEVKCSQCGAHLGHVFDDGPRPTGLRYCLNSAVLNLVPTPQK